MSVAIDAGFDGGNIRVVRVDDDVATLEIVTDAHSDFYQWFSFRVSGARGRTLTFRIVNAGASAYPKGWEGYRTRVSTDRATWTMAPDTAYADGVLTWSHAFERDVAWFAYFQPYTMDRHEALIARAANADGFAHRQIGRTLDGRAIDLLTVGTGPRSVWLYARQHPGEPMAEWWMEGAIDALAAPDATMAELLTRATVYLVPNMNPDGSYRGHLRTNGVGTNLNREWHAPSAERSPEVVAVLAAMDEHGVDVAMDIHGDEAIPANFLAGFEGIPSLTDAQAARYARYRERLEAATPEFQTALGYPTVPAGRGNLSMSTNQVAERFGALAMTLEMPFKDHDPNPDPVHGWDGRRSAALARPCLETVLADLRDLG